MWRSVLSGTGFSLWGFVLASDQTPQAEARATEPSEFRGTPALQVQCADNRGTATKKRLRNVLAAARAQIHARPSGGTQLHIQRRVKHLLQ